MLHFFVPTMRTRAMWKLIKNSQFEQKRTENTRFTAKIYQNEKGPQRYNLEKMKNVIRISDEELYTFYTEYKTILPESITLFENLFNIVFSEKK